MSAIAWLQQLRITKDTDAPSVAFPLFGLKMLVVVQQKTKALIRESAGVAHFP